MYYKDHIITVVKENNTGSGLQEEKKIKLIDKEGKIKDLKEFPELEPFQNILTYKQIASKSVEYLEETQRNIQDNIRFLKAIFVEYFTGRQEESSKYLYEHMEIMLNTAINEIERTEQKTSKKIEETQKLLKENQI